MKKLIKRVKTLYWFWKLTDQYIEDDRWVIEVGHNHFDEPRGKSWMELWTPDHWMMINKKPPTQGDNH